jgi:hypothetical protein
MAGVPLPELISRIIRIAQHFKIQCIALDPVYKMNTEGDENSSRDQTIFFNELDRLATEANCTVILNDHFSKGNQSEKDPLDAIRGSSSKGGDVDAAMVLRRHEVENCFRVDMIHRELAPVAPFCIGWEFPLFRLRTDLNADAMKKAKAGRHKAHDPVKLCAAIVGTSKDNPISVSAWAEAAGINRNTLSGGYMPDLRSKGWIATTGDGNDARPYLTDKGKAAVSKSKGEA